MLGLPWERVLGSRREDFTSHCLYTYSLEIRHLFESLIHINSQRATIPYHLSKASGVKQNMHSWKWARHETIDLFQAHNDYQWFNQNLYSLSSPLVKLYLMTGILLESASFSLALHFMNQISDTSVHSYTIMEVVCILGMRENDFIQNNTSF